MWRRNVICEAFCNDSTGVTDNAIVIDIGGTSTDVGYLMKGFPRESSSRSHIAGVSTNFRMPDVQCIGLGGGSLVQGDRMVRKMQGIWQGQGQTCRGDFWECSQWATRDLVWGQIDLWPNGQQHGSDNISKPSSVRVYPWAGVSILGYRETVNSALTPSMMKVFKHTVPINCFVILWFSLFCFHSEFIKRKETVHGYLQLTFWRNIWLFLDFSWTLP